MLEIIASELSMHNPYKMICKCVNRGEKELVLRYIEDEALRDFISKAIEEDFEKRATVE